MASLFRVITSLMSLPNCAVSRCLFVAAVARVMRPGCKADYVP